MVVSVGMIWVGVERKGDLARSWGLPGMAGVMKPGVPVLCPLEYPLQIG